MQLDFHYCALRVILEKSGFSAEDAQIISYASQYVDDATDHEKMNVDGHLDILSRRFADNTFNPICTAHKGLQFIKAFSQDVQDKIYISFHFLPDLETNSEMKVTKDCSLSRKLIMQALIELCKGTGEQRILNLIKLGIALHTYADSWAHQNFSGRHSSKDNDIRDIAIFRNGNWENISSISEMEYNSMPDIGHAEAASYPDQSHLKWRYVKESDGKIHERDNTHMFIDAAEHIYNILKGKWNDEIWPDTKSRLAECFAYIPESLEEKIKKFQSVFPEIGFYYDASQWRNEAILTVKSSKLFKMKEEKHQYVLGSDKKWFYFHLAALEQREYILGIIEKKRLSGLKS